MKLYVKLKAFWRFSPLGVYLGVGMLLDTRTIEFCGTVVRKPERIYVSHICIATL